MFYLYSFSEDLYYKWVFNFVIYFFYIYWDGHMIFIILFVNMAYHTDLQILNHPCILELNLSWSWCIIFLIYCWNWFTNILLRIFASMFVIDVCMCWYWPVIFFVWFLCNFLIFVGILYQDDAGIVEWLGSDKSLIIWDSLRRIGVNFSLNIWYNSPVKSSGPGLLFLRRFF